MEMLELAQQYVNDGISRDTTNTDSLTLANLDSLQSQVHTLISNDLVAVRSPLGLGWNVKDEAQLKSAGFGGWAKKLVGLLITALAISLGAPFWFDLLKKLVNIRNTGKKAG